MDKNIHPGISMVQAPGAAHQALFQLGPAVGAVLADLVRDGRTATSIDAFSV